MKCVLGAECFLGVGEGGTLGLVWPTKPKDAISQQMSFKWDGSVGKKSACNAVDAEDSGSIPGSRRFPGKGNGNPLQYSCWKIPWTEEPGRLQSIGLQKSQT